MACSSRSAGSSRSLAALFQPRAGCVLTTLAFTLPSITVSFSPLLFFAPYCLLLGYLIFRSTFLPHILGVLMALGRRGLAGLSPPQPPALCIGHPRGRWHLRGSIPDALAHRDEA
jgi:hypothetical protein